jgi:hypothetical protein
VCGRVWGGVRLHVQFPVSWCMCCGNGNQLVEGVRGGAGDGGAYSLDRRVRIVYRGLGTAFVVHETGTLNSYVCKIPASTLPSPTPFGGLLAL